MIRRTALLSALTISLLLSACSKNKEDTAEDMEAQAASDVHTQADAGADQALPPKPRANYWPVVGTLLAGSYGGECMRMPDMRKLDDASIAVAADGNVAAGDLKVDFREADTATLSRGSENGGPFRSTAIISMKDSKAGMLSMQQERGNRTVSFTRDNVGLMCTGTIVPNKLDTEPLYLALAGVINLKKQTLGCLDPKNMLVRTDTGIEINDGVIKIGDASFDTKAARFEVANVSAAGERISLSYGMQKDLTFSFTYDGAGKLTQVTGKTSQENLYYCEEKK